MQKMLENQRMCRSWRIFLKNNRQSNCPAPTMDHHKTKTVMDHQVIRKWHSWGWKDSLSNLNTKQNHRGSFCPFTRDALNFRQPKIYATPHRTAMFQFPLSLSRHHCTAWRSVQYSALSICSVTAHAHRNSRVRSNDMPTRNVYVRLVYLYFYLFAVELLCCHMLLYSWSGQRWSNLLHWSAPRYALLTFADNTALPGFLYFIHVHLMFPCTESSFLFILH